VDGLTKFSRLIIERHRNPFCLAFRLAFVAVLAGTIWRHSPLGIAMALAALTGGPFLFEVPEQTSPILEKMVLASHRWLDQARGVVMIAQVIVGAAVFTRFAMALWANDPAASVGWLLALLVFKLGLLAWYARGLDGTGTPSV